MDYKDKNDLIAEIDKRYHLFLNEFEEIDADSSVDYYNDIDKNPRQIIIYQIGWMNLLMLWDRKEIEGISFSMPLEGYKWNKLGDLQKHFYKEYEDYSYEELKYVLNIVYINFITWIDMFEDEELFNQGFRKWTGDKDNWPLAKWIHINSVAPFKSFRTKIRKWKKLKNELN